MVELGGGVLLEARGLEKRFPGVRALAGVDFQVRAGETVAVVGENGAGKSTLMKILAGVLTPDGGTLQVDGRSVRFADVAAAQAAGVALIHQELCSCERLDVAANVVLGRESRRGLGRLDPADCDARARVALARIGLDVDLRTQLAELSIADRQRVEIAKALDTGARVLIMDEPTSSLSTTETERLFDLVRDLTESGTAVVYISHRLGEVEALADRAVVLRDGQFAGELARAEIDHDALVRLMVGRDVSKYFARKAQASGDVALDVRGVRTQAWPQSAVDLEVRRGEVVGLAGLVGAGRTELLRALFGLDAPLDGTVDIAGRRVHGPERSAEPSEVLSAGLALVSEDRKREGIFEDASVGRNLTLARLARDARHGIVDRRAEERLAESLRERVGVRAATLDVPVGTLSGGNQQKVVLGRAFACEPHVLLLDEPTRGVDIGAKAEIYELIDALAREGLAVLFASSEMEEILGLSDRCLVLRDGAVTGELPRSELTEEAVMQLATREPSRQGAVG